MFITIELHIILYNNRAAGAKNFGDLRISSKNSLPCFAPFLNKGGIFATICSDMWVDQLLDCSADPRPWVWSHYGGFWDKFQTALFSFSEGVEHTGFSWQELRVDSFEVGKMWFWTESFTSVVASSDFYVWDCPWFSRCSTLSPPDVHTFLKLPASNSHQQQSMRSTPSNEKVTVDSNLSQNRAYQLKPADAGLRQLSVPEVGPLTY